MTGCQAVEALHSGRTFTQLRPAALGPCFSVLRCTHLLTDDHRNVAWCPQAAGGRQLPTFCIPRRLSSTQLGAVLAPLQQERVLHFADAHEAWGGFARSQVGSRVLRHLASQQRGWCG
jgi:hypothetical protein